MRGRRALLLGLAIVFALAAVWLVACGGSDEEAKAALRTALDKVETTINDMTAKMMGGGSAADLMAVKDQFGADWQAVVTAAKDVDGADVAAAEEAWTKLDAAFGALPENPSLTDLSSTVLPPFMALQGVMEGLRELAGPSE